MEFPSSVDIPSKRRQQKNQKKKKGGGERNGLSWFAISSQEF